MLDLSNTLNESIVGAFSGECRFRRPRHGANRRLELAVAHLLLPCCGQWLLSVQRLPTVAGPQPPAPEPVTQVATSGGSETSREITQSSEVPSTEQNAATDVQPATPSEPPAPPESKERILFLAPSGPLIIDFVLTIDGRPHTEALSRLVDEVLKLADTDGDGRTTWKECCACEKIKYGQFGNLPIDGDNSEKQIIERYDIARDGIVDRSELPRFLTRNAGGSRPFSIRGTFNHRSGNRKVPPHGMSSMPRPAGHRCRGTKNRRHELDCARYGR